MRASPVRIYAGVETDVGAVVAGYDGAGVVAQVEGVGGWPLALQGGLRIDLDPLEAVLRVARGAAARDTPWSLSLPHPSILMDGYGYTTARLARLRLQKR